MAYTRNKSIAQLHIENLGGDVAVEKKKLISLKERWPQREVDIERGRMILSRHLSDLWGPGHQQWQKTPK